MLGDVLVRLGCIDGAQLVEALSGHKERGIPLGQALVEDRFCSEREVMRALALQSRMKLMPVNAGNWDPSLASMLPEKLARYHRAVPMGLLGETLHVAMAAPMTREAMADVRDAVVRRKVELFLASDEEIARRILFFYGPNSSSHPLPAVLIHGWSSELLGQLPRQLQEMGLPARAANALDVVEASPEDVLVVRLPALKALVPSGRRLKCHVVVQGDGDLADLEYARELGARAFVPGLFDVDLWARAIRRFLPVSAAA
jgi:type IV pilus assembly protein PilB